MTQWAVGPQLSPNPGATVMQPPNWITCSIVNAVACLMAATAGAACVELSPEDVLVVPHGFLIRSHNEFVHYDDALPSRTQTFWFCAAETGSDLSLYVPRDLTSRMAGTPTAGSAGAPLGP
jgi:hypothetical protein